MKNALVVSQHDENICYLKDLLESQGWRTVTARQGDEALTKARQKPPDLIISDLRMPIMDGHTLLRHCKSDGRLGRVPFIVYAAPSTSSEDERLARELGAEDFFRKPTEPEVLLLCLRELAERGKVEVDPCQRQVLQQQAIMDVLPAQIALLDQDGRIRSVNQAWRQFALENGFLHPDFGVGLNYLAVTLPEGEPTTLAGLREVLAGTRNSDCSEYFCRAPDKDRWFRMMVSALPDQAGAVVMHVDITDQVMAEASLRESEALLKMGGRAAKLGSWAVDYPEARVTWSEQSCEIHEVPPETAPPLEQCLQFYTPEWRPVVTQAIEACRKDGIPFDLELEILTARGRRVWVRNIGEAIRDCEGRVRRLQGAFQDISDLRRAAEETRVSQERYRLLARVVEDAIWDCDVNSGKISWNEGFASLTGLDPAETASHLGNWALLLHPQERSGVLASLEACMVSRQLSWREEHRFLRSDGNYAWVLNRVSVIRDSSQKALRLVGIMTDLTAQRKAQEHMAEQAALIDLARDAIIVHDLENRVLSWSQGAQRVYGWGEKEVLGQFLPELLGSEGHSFAAARQCVLETGLWNGETARLTRSKEKLTVDSRWTLVRDAEGRPRSILTLESDITDRKQVEAQFLRAQRLESVGTLAGGVAHDLNNVLAPILMAVSLLKLEETKEDKLQTLSTIESCAQRGAEMVKQVLSFARGVEGQKLPVRGLRLIEDVVRIIKDTFPRNIQVQQELAPDLWEVSGDETQLHQVLLNLTVNARDAMPKGGILKLSGFNQNLDEQYAALSGQVAPGNYVCLRVEDSGTGMPAEILDKIFEPFFTTKQIGSGTGLGLSTSMAILKSHGGFIRCSSQLGRGSRFEVYLPAQTEQSGELARETEALVRGNGELILVVDDEASVRQVTKQTLEGFGYRVVLASDGAEAVALFARQQEEISLVLTDLVMPILDGPATIHALLRIKPTLAIVAASGLGSNGGVAQAASAGVKHFLSKPYNASLLLNTLRQALGGPD